MRQRFSGGRLGCFVGGWHLEKAHGSVPCFLGLLAGHRFARQDCKQLFITSRASSLLLPRHRNDC